MFSGGLTLATFLPMSKKLQRHLATLELTKPGLRADETDHVDTGTEPGEPSTADGADEVSPVLSETSRSDDFADPA